MGEITNPYADRINEGRDLAIDYQTFEDGLFDARMFVNAVQAALREAPEEAKVYIYINKCLRKITIDWERPLNTEERMAQKQALIKSISALEARLAELDDR